MRKIFFILLLLTPFLQTDIIWAQPDAVLAKQYFDNGEFEKAVTLFEKLYKQTPASEYYFTNYYQCLTELNRYDDAESVIKKRIKENTRSSYLYVAYGMLLEKQGKQEKADELYKKGIDNLPADNGEIVRLATSYLNAGKFEFAIKAYERGSELLKDRAIYAFELAEAYRQKGDLSKTIEYYLNSLEYTPGRMPMIQSYIQRNLDNSTYNALQEQLLARAQSQPDTEIWPEMLSWLYLQRKDFKNAFRQVLALDRRLQENGNRVYHLAYTARREKAYDAAIDGFQYIVEKKGPTNPFYFEAKNSLLETRQEKITEGFAYTKEDITNLENDYESFLKEFGKSKQTAKLILSYANMEAYYANKLDKSIEMLKEVIEFPFNEKNAEEAKLKAQSKLDLGDYYLMKGEEWEATLLYSQVDKANKEGVMGEMARFKNAKLSYYQGDFEWAQGQLTALKASTSKLISNDAIELSVFIMENYNLDSTATPMEMFARSELLTYRNRFDEAFSVMDSIERMFPKHKLWDHILYEKADIYIKRRDFVKAFVLLDSIANGAQFKESILRDNAVYRVAQMYENSDQLNDKEKAKAYYQKIITDFASSIYVVEARKRFRILRGDKLDGVQ